MEDTAQPSAGKELRGGSLRDHVKQGPIHRPPLTPFPETRLADWVRAALPLTDGGAELPEDTVDRDQLLTNVTLYWLTGTAASSTWMYYEGAAGWSPAQSKVPTGNVVFPNDASVRRTAERENKIVHWSTFDRGGHFAAMEVPDLLVGDIREFYSKLR